MSNHKKSRGFFYLDFNVLEVEYTEILRFTLPYSHNKVLLFTISSTLISLFGACKAT